MDAPPPPKPLELTLQQALDTALQLQSAHRFADATAIYQFILQRWPDHPDALAGLGAAAFQTGQLQEAENWLGRAIAAEPGRVDFHLSLGRILFAQDRAAQAVTCFTQAASLDPKNAQAFHYLGIALQDIGNFNDAVAALRTAVQLAPNDANAWTDLGVAIQSSGGNVAEAADAYRRALAINPKLVAALSNLAETERLAGRYDQAVAAAAAALAIDPNFATAHLNLAAALQSQHRIEESIPPLERAIQLAPCGALAHASLAGAFQSMGRVDDAAEMFRKATKLQPDHAPAWSGLLYTSLFRMAPTPTWISQQHLAWGNHASNLLRASPQRHDNDRSPHRRLRIGYVSSDLRGHSVAFFFEPILAHHNRDKFEPICYFDWQQADDVTARLRTQAAGWRDVAGWSDERLTQQIRDDRIDLLIDLAGHTAHNRLLVFARKPAPVQITYLGYPATTGLAQMDYRLTDAIADPPGESESLHSEQLIRLPHAWCYRPPDDCPDVSPLPAERTAVTFGCFNHIAKLSPETIVLFATVLLATPSSKLLLKSGGLQSPLMRQRLLEMFSRHGITASRVEMLQPTPRHQDHLETYHRVDIALDTFPYAGTTTTCEALWMGVPVITLAGSAHVSRVGASLLSAVSLADLVARDSTEYARIAASLAGDLPRLAELRRTLRERMRHSPLTDAAGFTHHLEAAYRDLWQRWIAAQS